MAVSNGLLEVRSLLIGLLLLSYFTSNFDWVCGKLHGLIRACISRSLVIYVAVPFKIEMDCPN